MQYCQGAEMLYGVPAGVPPDQPAGVLHRVHPAVRRVLRQPVRYSQGNAKLIFCVDPSYSFENLLLFGYRLFCSVIGLTNFAQCQLKSVFGSDKV